MNKKRIVLSQSDYIKLKKLLEALKKTNRCNSIHFRHLDDEMAHALMMEPENLPKDRVTLHSKVRYKDLKNNSEHEAVIVFPGEKDKNEHSYSILAPLGTALIGEKKGSTTICYAPGGEIPLKIIEVC